MKPRAKRKKTMRTLENESSATGQPRYAIHPISPDQSSLTRRTSPSSWHLTFRGQNAQFKHEQGAFYVAWLLLNPPSEPIHGLGLELKASAYYGQLTGETIFIDPVSGKNIPLPSDAMLVQRNLAVDDLDAAHSVNREIRKLEAILEDPDVIEPVKAEVARELVQIYAFQKKNPLQIADQAQKAVRSVREAIRHLHRSLATANSSDGAPDPILRQFGFHLLRYLLIPSARYSKAGRGRTKTGVAGCFTYEPPPGVIWNP